MFLLHLCPCLPLAPLCCVTSARCKGHDEPGSLLRLMGKWEQRGEWGPKCKSEIHVNGSRTFLERYNTNTRCSFIERMGKRFHWLPWAIWEAFQEVLRCIYVNTRSKFRSKPRQSKSGQLTADSSGFTSLQTSSLQAWHEGQKFYFSKFPSLDITELRCHTDL